MIDGRKKLVKLAFFAEPFNPESDGLQPSVRVDQLAFEIRRYGPFSVDAVNTCEDLQKQGSSRTRSQTTPITTGPLLSRETSPESRWENVYRPISGVSSTPSRRNSVDTRGTRLQTRSLEMLGIGVSEIDRYRGIPVEEMLAVGKHTSRISGGLTS